MRIVPIVCLGVLLIAAGMFIHSVAGQLPERVATHFDAAGQANGYVSRESCRIFMLEFTLGVPIFIAALTGSIPWLAPPWLINIPNREYWLASERARDSRAFLSEQGIWFACILLVFLTAANWLVVSANTAAQAQLRAAPFTTALVLFFTALGFWLLRMIRRFGKPRT